MFFNGQTQNPVNAELNKSTLLKIHKALKKAGFRKAVYSPSIIRGQVFVEASGYDIIPTFKVLDLKKHVDPGTILKNRYELVGLANVFRMGLMEPNDGTQPYCTVERRELAVGVISRFATVMYCEWSGVVFHVGDGNPVGTKSCIYQSWG